MGNEASWTRSENCAQGVLCGTSPRAAAFEGPSGALTAVPAHGGGKPLTQRDPPWVCGQAFPRPRGEGEGTLGSPLPSRCDSPNVGLV